MGSSRAAEVWSMPPQRSGVLKPMASGCQVDSLQVVSHLHTDSRTFKVKFGIFRGVSGPMYVLRVLDPRSHHWSDSNDMPPSVLWNTEDSLARAQAPEGSSWTDCGADHAPPVCPQPLHEQKRGFGHISKACSSSEIPGKSSYPVEEGRRGGL